VRARISPPQPSRKIVEDPGHQVARMFHDPLIEEPIGPSVET
jgi:hypothetical protein